MFKLWSEINPQIKDILMQVSGIEWSELTTEEKKLMWKYLEIHFFDSNPRTNEFIYMNIKSNYIFQGKDAWEKRDRLVRVGNTMHEMNEKYKKRSFARNLIKDSKYDSACHDFNEIFINAQKDIVFEMISIYSKNLIDDESRKLENEEKEEHETEEDFLKRLENSKWNYFDTFANRLSEVFIDFGIKYKLTRLGFMIADEPVIIEKIYIPALSKLSSRQWEVVNREFRDAFDSLDKDMNGSTALTHTLSALQGFLQILVHGKIGKGATSGLIKEGIKKGVIPDNDFSKQIIMSMNSFWAQERQNKGDPHPKIDYATKGEAKLVISLVMVFVDHVL